MTCRHHHHHHHIVPTTYLQWAEISAFLLSLRLPLKIQRRFVWGYYSCFLELLHFEDLGIMRRTLLVCSVKSNFLFSLLFSSLSSISFQCRGGWVGYYMLVHMWLGYSWDEAGCWWLGGVGRGMVVEWLWNGCGVFVEWLWNGLSWWLRRGSLCRFGLCLGGSCWE